MTAGFWTERGIKPCTRKTLYPVDIPGYKVGSYRISRTSGGADDGSGSGSYSKDYDEISKLKEIADLNNKSIIAIHHLRQKPDLNDPFNEITGTNGITGVSDTNIVLKRREGSTTAEMYVRGRDVEERKLILEFVDLRWHMLEEKSAAEIEKEKIPEVLYKVADFIKQEGSWFGSASQLQAAINDSSIPANQMAKQITRHYYEVFFPECIRFEKPPRKNNVRGMRLYVDLKMLKDRPDRKENNVADDVPGSDDSDACDGSSPGG